MSGSSRRARVGCLAAISFALALFALPQSALAFGTVWGIFGQRSEHERITRLALQCGGGVQPPNCLEPVTLDNLAGKHGTYGAVGAPDDIPSHLDNDRDYWHCDNADYANPTVYGIGSYPRTRHDALNALRQCLAWGRDKLYDGGGGWKLPPATPSNGTIATAAQLVSTSGKVDASDPGVGIFSPLCYFNGVESGRAKCNILDPFGYVLHMAEDFYSHTNWADFSSPGEPLSLGNPYGLGNSEVAPFLDLRGPPPNDDEVPANFTGGCYPKKTCAGRIIHGESETDRGLNKDKAYIDTTTGRVGDPRTPRGAIVVNGVSNVQRAVNVAVLEVRRQWEVLRAELVQRYGSSRGSRMVCALALDRSEVCEKRNVVVVVDAAPPRRGAAPQGTSPTVLAAQAVVDQLEDEDSVALVAFDGDTGAVDVDDFAAPDQAVIDDDPDQGDAAADPTTTVGAEGDPNSDPPVTPVPDVPHDVPPLPGTYTSGSEEGGEKTIEPESRRLSGARSPLLRPRGAGVSRALDAAGALLVDDDIPRGQRGVIIVSDGTDARRRLASRVRALGRRHAYVSLALDHGGRIPAEVIRAVEGAGGIVVAGDRPAELSRFAALADDAGFTRLDDALPEQGAPLAPGNPAILGVADGIGDLHPIERPRRRENLVVEALDHPLTLLVTDHATAKERRLQVAPGERARVALRSGGDFDVAIDGARDPEYRAAVHHG